MVILFCQITAVWIIKYDPNGADYGRLHRIVVLEELAAIGGVGAQAPPDDRPALALQGHITLEGARVLFARRAAHFGPFGVG